MNLRIKKDEDFRYATSLRFLNLKPGFKIQSVRAADPLATLEAPDGYRRSRLRLCHAALPRRLLLCSRRKKEKPSAKLSGARAGRSQPSQNKYGRVIIWQQRFR